MMETFLNVGNIRLVNDRQDSAKSKSMICNLSRISDHRVLVSQSLSFFDEKLRGTF